MKSISDPFLRRPVLTLVISLLVLTVLVVLRKDLLLFCFDPTHARSIGLHTGVLHYLLLYFYVLPA